MIKKLNILLLVLILVLGCAVMAGAVTPAATGTVTPAAAGAVTPAATGTVTPTATGSKAVKSLSLDEALKLAEENNTMLFNANIELEKAKVQVEQAQHAYEQIKDAQDIPGYGYAVSTFDTAGRAYISKENAAEWLNIYQKSFDVAHEQIKLLIKSKYYAVLEKQDTVNVKQAALERSQKQLDVANASFKVGSVAKTDVLSAEMGLANAKSELTGAQNAYQLAVIALNREIGLDIGTPLNLTTKVDKQDVLGSVKLDQYISEALTSRLDVAQGEATIKADEISYKTLLTYKGGKSYDAKLANYDLEKAKKSLETTKQGVAYDVTQAYLNVQAAGQSLAFLEKAVEQAQENMRLSELRYQVGAGTSLELMDASVKLNEMETSRLQALYGYNLAKMTFETVKLAPVSAASSAGAAASASAGGGY